MLNLVVYPNPTSVLDTAICFGTSYQGYSNAGTYNAMYKSVNGCDSTHTLNLTILPDINASPYSDTILCTGDSIILSPGIFDSYLWQDGSISSSFIVSHGGTYSVKISNKCGMATRTTVINERVCNIMFPNAFTPNRDGLNDVFNILNAYDLSYYRMVIFNRWGQKIFESNDSQNGWDGLIKGLSHR
ncbi:MAG: gliding motility-associated C-terminal domain-containing protein [Bacteroidota bacterium]|nr:gliding motility-associated C-terminal domain-containing protein [Bacteroidota bacterium]